MAFYIHLPNGLAVDPADVTAVTTDYDDTGDEHRVTAVHVWTTYDQSAPTWTFAGADVAPAIEAVEAHDLEIS